MAKVQYEAYKSDGICDTTDDGMIKLRDVHYQTEPKFFPKQISGTVTPVSVRLFFEQLTYTVLL